MLTEVFICFIGLWSVSSAEQCAGIFNRKEICCDNNGVGCFQRDYPFDSMPLPCCPEWDEVDFRLFTRNNLDQYIKISNGEGLPTEFSNEKRTVFITHGWMCSGGVDNCWLPQLKDTFLDKHDYNVIVISWKKAAGKVYYPEAASTTRVVGAMLATLMERLVTEAEVRWEDMWCVGHSLGSHVCGHAGMRTPEKIARITGLDPAGPWFEGVDSLEVGLNPKSAVFVDVIHTDTKGSINTYGTTRPIGHMDFYPNGLGRQPGCVDRRRRGAGRPFGILGCSHDRSNTFFIEAIVNEDCFTATHVCDTVEDNMPLGCRECQPGECPSMGLSAELSNQPGIYYLQTSSNYPPHCLNFRSVDPQH